MYLQLGWRNIWRNPRRTAVILSAIVIGVWSMIFLGAMMRGITDQMVRNGIATLTGHIQIHHSGYRQDPVIENRMAQTGLLELTIKTYTPPGTLWVKRVRVNAVASNAHHSGGVTLVGIEPEKEAVVSFIGSAVKRGRTLKPDEAYGIVVGRAFLEKFETRLGRKLVLTSRDTQGEVVSRAFRIIGVFQAEVAATEKGFVFVSLRAAQQMLKLKEDISEVSILLSQHTKAKAVSDVLRRRLPPNDYEVHTWQELLPMVTAMMKLYDGFIFLWFVVVFIAMSFGIVNTTLMAVFERIREFGLLKALGMRTRRIVREVMTESFLLLIIGMLVGNCLGFLSVVLLADKGIDLSSMAAGVEF
ncbi:MAG: ABC transporter permease, partial [Desulfobacterales bacterium]